MPRVHVAMTVRRMGATAACLVLVAGCSAPFPTPTSSHTLLVPTASTSASVTAEPPLARGWTVVPPESLNGLRLEPVIALADGTLLAFGQTYLAGPDGRLPAPSIWTSPDGIRWTPGEASDAFVPVRDRWNRVPLDAVESDVGFAVVGMNQFDDGSQADAAAWFSPDGGTWQPAAVDEGSGRTVDEVVITNTGLVAFGDARYDIHAGLGDGTAIWTSPDGRSWTRPAGDEAPLLGVRLRNVTRFGRGWLATATAQMSEGVDGLPRPPVTGGVWRSDDAVHWTAIAGSPLEIGQMAADARGVTVIGRRQAASGDDVPVMWRSVDGSAWRTTVLPLVDPLPADGSLYPALIVTGDGGWLAVAEGGADSMSVAWGSADGATWIPVAPMPVSGVRIERVTPFGSSFLVTGSRDDTSDGISDPVTLVLTP